MRKTVYLILALFPIFPLEETMRIRPVIAAREIERRRLPQPVPVLYFDRVGEERHGNVVAVRGDRGCLVFDLATGDETWCSPFELVDDE